MANIATVMTAVMIRPGVEQDQLTAQGLLEVMTEFTRGKSFYVPAWSREAWPHRCIYMQHGEKWSSHGVRTTWERYGSLFEKIWVRWYDSGADHDNIYRWDAESHKALERSRRAVLLGEGQPGDRKPPPKISRKCRYEFDEVRISGIADLDSQVAGAEWKSLRPRVWAADMRGTYLADNDRCDLDIGYEHLGLANVPSQTTPVRAHQVTPPLSPPLTPLREQMLRSRLEWSRDDLLSEVRQLEELVFQSATRVEFLWRGQPTRIYERLADCWWRWCLDDWDNCADPQWRADLSARNDG